MSMLIICSFISFSSSFCQTSRRVRRRICGLSLRPSATSEFWINDCSRYCAFVVRDYSSAMRTIQAYSVSFKHHPQSSLTWLSITRLISLRKCSIASRNLTMSAVREFGANRHTTRSCSVTIGRGFILLLLSPGRGSRGRG